MVRLLFLLLIAMFSLACGGNEAIGSEECELLCPEGQRIVERCPAFEECETLVSCGEIVLCAPAVDGDGEEEGSAGGSCQEPPSCPAGSMEVESCPDEGVCTWINMCEVALICLELPDACAQEPLCPDGDRGVTDRSCPADDPVCYGHFHCSGPVVCLRCEELAESCPEEMVAVEEEECGEERELCERVDTCEETLFCQAPICEDPEAPCPEPTIRWEECSEEESSCFALEDQCEETYFCGIPEEEQEDCRAIPVCPEGTLEADLERCLLDGECELIAKCNQLIGCLPE